MVFLRSSSSSQFVISNNAILLRRIKMKEIKELNELATLLDDQKGLTLVYCTENREKIALDLANHIWGGSDNSIYIHIPGVIEFSKTTTIEKAITEEERGELFIKSTDSNEFEDLFLSDNVVCIVDDIFQSVEEFKSYLLDSLKKNKLGYVIITDIEQLIADSDIKELVPEFQGLSAELKILFMAFISPDLQSSLGEINFPTENIYSLPQPCVCEIDENCELILVEPSV